MKRNLAIDLIKIIAMFGVLALHIRWPRETNMPMDSELRKCWYPIVGVAMPLFFMVSGYLMYNKTITWNYIYRKISGIIKFVTIIISLYIIPYILVTHDYNSWKWYLACYIQAGKFFQFWYFGSIIIIYLMLPYLSKLMHSKFLNNAIISLIIICSFVFFLNWMYSFEKRYTIQTFRLWNWILYFLLGGWVCKNQNKLIKISWRYSLFFCFFSTAFLVSTWSYLGKVWCYFCSLPFILYVAITFIGIHNMRIQSNKIISNLASLFLPVYALHIVILDFYYTYLAIPVINPTITLLYNYIISSTIIIVICELIMQIPISNKIFRI